MTVAGSPREIGIIPARAGFTYKAAQRWRAARDHPRSRGVYGMMVSSLDRSPGSSPLARGLLRTDVLLAAGVRIIPARAGFTGDRGRLLPGAGDHPRSRGAYEAVEHPGPADPDHPRSRGVYRRARSASSWSSGSSPLARGLLAPHEIRSDGVRIIPARAGFTRRPRAAHLRWEDHPRSRGVYAGSRPPARRAAGSSPLARGLRGGGVDRAAHRRIIPARAGFTAWSTGRPTRWADHPRSRGVYTGCGSRRTTATGSSPLARGLLLVGGPEALLLGIIPARAGFTPVADGGRAVGRDHPRSRGVYRFGCRAFRSRQGSSPLARGLLMGLDYPTTARRIIPARAGFTRRIYLHRARPPDHPRSRGVYDAGVITSGFLGGSSPLARGLLHAFGRINVRPGIIPARAGFTHPGDSGRLGYPDHPRSRGVYASEPWKTSRSRGSSPLARGLHRGVRHHRGARRIIPARAGFTKSTRT